MPNGIGATDQWALLPPYQVQASLCQRRNATQAAKHNHQRRAVTPRARRLSPPPPLRPPEPASCSQSDDDSIHQTTRQRQHTNRSPRARGEIKSPTPTRHPQISLPPLPSPAAARSLARAPPRPPDPMAPAAAAGPSPRRRFAAAVVALALALVLAPAAARPDKEMREKFYGTLVTNGTHNATGDGSIAEMFGRVLDKEFADSDTPDGANLDLRCTGLAREAFGFFREKLPRRSVRAE